MTVSCRFFKCCQPHALPLRVSLGGWESPALRSARGSQDTAMRRHQDRFPSAAISAQGPEGKISHFAWMLSPRVAEGHPRTVPGIRILWQGLPAFSQFSSQNAAWRCPCMAALFRATLFPPAHGQQNCNTSHPDCWSINSPQLIFGSSP